MKKLSLVLLSILSIACGAAVSQAQDKFPSSPIRFILPYGPGTATDIITRVMCEELRQILGQSCVVDNKPGAFGILAIEEMARARPNGYTLQVGNVSTNAITPVLFAPAATPPDVLQTLQSAVTKSLNSPKVVETYAKQNIRSRPTASLGEAKTWLQGEVAHWQKIIKEVKIDLKD